MPISEILDGVWAENTAIIAHSNATTNVHGAGTNTIEHTGNKNAANGYPSLDINALLSLAQQRLNFKIGYFDRDTSISSGTQAITGIGFVPRAIIMLAITGGQPGEASVGFSDGITHRCIENYHQVSANQWSSYPAVIVLWQGNSILYSGIISSFDADGFTMSWTKIGAKTGTANIIYLAVR